MSLCAEFCALCALADNERKTKLAAEAELTAKEARQILQAVGAVAAAQKKEAVKAAEDLLNNVENRLVARAAYQPQKQKAEQVIDAFQAARTLQATLKTLKELKAPFCLLRAHQTLQELLITGCYQDLLETEEAKEIILDDYSVKVTKKS